MIIENLLLITIFVLSDKRSTDYTKDEIEKYWKKWQDKFIEPKMKKIAICLYNMRSLYTQYYPFKRVNY